ncbi:MAG: TetR-like C-terminal domain-containing protein [Anaerolineae bacterium]
MSQPPPLAVDQSVSASLEIVATFVAGALFNLITYWLNTEPTYSAREIAHMFAQTGIAAAGLAIQLDTAESLNR